MKFFICDKLEKFTKKEYNCFGKWYFYYDDKVSLYEGSDFIVLYCGYLIEGDIEEVAANFSFHDANGNFFAVKLTKTDYEISLDYFQNHKIFVADKYGIEITNYMPFMACEKDDIKLKRYPTTEREFGVDENTTYYGHINSFIPNFDYIQDVKDSFGVDAWDIDELLEHIHQCMLQHSNVIKSKYKNRFISLSEGIDSALQSQYFYDDPQFIYGISLEGDHWRRQTIKNFPNVTYDIIPTHGKETKQITLDYFVDPSSRGQTILPTMKQISDCGQKPDIVMYGVNADEAFVKELNPHMFMVGLNNFFERDFRETLRQDAINRKEQYGSTYSTSSDTEKWIDIFFRRFVDGEKDYENFQYNFYTLLTPKFYTRAISANNDVMSGSLYNDRRIFHEIMRLPLDWLIEHGMDAPFLKRLLKDKFNYDFTTPYKDAVDGVYDGVWDNHFEATHTHCLEQNL